MIKEIIKKAFFGLITGFAVYTLTTLVLLLFVSEFEVYLNKAYMLRSILSSAVVGIAFFVPSLVYDYERIPQPVKVVIHMGIGYLFFFPLAIYAKWFPVDAGAFALIGSIVFALVISISIWFGFYLYYKHEVKLMNNRLKKED